MVTRRRLKFAGWLSISMAAILVLGVMSLPAYFKVEALEGFFVTGLGAINLALFIYTRVTLRDLLNARFGFHKVDRYISVLIWFNILILLISAIPVVEQNIYEPIYDILIVLNIPLGIIVMMFGVKLLSLPDNLYGLLIPFSYIEVFNGLCSAIFFLAPLRTAGVIASDVILGIIFFNIAKHY